MVLRSVISKPMTRLYPFERRPSYKNTRGSVGIDINRCSMCTLCQKKCPTAAITVNRNEKIWEIDRLRCIMCAACVESCPKKCLSMENQYSSPSTERSVDRFIQEKKLEA